MDEKLSWVYMTCGSLDEARKLGQVLLEKNLAACVNILDGMRSLYRWEGAVQEDQPRDGRPMEQDESRLPGNTP